MNKGKDTIEKVYKYIIFFFSLFLETINFVPLLRDHTIVDVVNSPILTYSG